jgi:hypothetical protein
MLGLLALGRRGLARGGVAAVLLAAVACGGNTESDANNGGSATSGGRAASGGRATTQGGATAKGGASSSSGGASTGGTGTGLVDDVDPNSAVAGATATGKGQCEGHSLGEVVMNVHAKHPELSDINTFYDPKLISPGASSNLIYAFPNDDGFRLVFTRGSGDCESGCINMAYWYFATGADCLPYLVGDYSREYNSDANCFAFTGSPRWGFPGAPPPAGNGCGAVPKDVSGTHQLHGIGTEYPCSLDGKSTGLIANVVLEVAQEADDLSRASVVISGTGNDLLDGQTFAASVTGSTLSVDETITKDDDESPDCGGRLHLTLSYDFSSATGSLTTEEVRYLDCGMMSYCKGALQLSLLKGP